MSLQLSLEPSDLLELYKAYMPFVNGGGLFIHTDKRVELQQIAEVSLRLPLESKVFVFTGRVIWISPEKTLFEKTNTGIGVRLEGPEAEFIRQKIENLIAEYLASEQPTDTM